MEFIPLFILLGALLFMPLIMTFKINIFIIIYLIIFLVISIYLIINNKQKICNFIKNIFKSNLTVLFLILSLLGILIIYNIVSIDKQETESMNIYLTCLGGIAVVFSYFYNKYEEKRIKVHSEANWRGRLFDLANKSDKTYNDILYFMTFFNNNPTSENDKDSRLLIAIQFIVNGEYNKALITNVQDILSEKHPVPNSIKDLIEDLMKILQKKYRITDKSKVEEIIYKNINIKCVKINTDDIQVIMRDDDTDNTITNIKDLILDSLQKLIKSSKSNDKLKQDDKIVNIIDTILNNKINKFVYSKLTDSEQDENISCIILNKLALNLDNQKYETLNSDQMVAFNLDNQKYKTLNSYQMVAFNLDNQKYETLNSYQMVAFNLCINYLLKKDWEEQMKN